MTEKAVEQAMVAVVKAQGAVARALVVATLMMAATGLVSWAVPLAEVMPGRVAV